jgi:hypothetical protein
MKLPEGLDIPKFDLQQVCKLQKSIYGLQQSSRAWYERFDTFFHYINFKQIEANPTIYIQVHDNNNFIILPMNVDGGIVVTPNLVLTSKLWTFLEKEFDMTYEGNIYYVVGLHIIHD